MHQTVHYKSQVLGKWENPAAAVAESAMLSQKSHELPGIDCRVKFPCDCPGQMPLRNVIMHLNDTHRWTREAIADYLDSVDDPENGIDLAFKVPEKEEE